MNHKALLCTRMTLESRGRGEGASHTHVGEGVTVRCWRSSLLYFSGAVGIFYSFQLPRSTPHARRPLSTVWVWWEAHTSVLTETKNAPKHTFPVPLAARMWACDPGSTNQMHPLWTLTRGLKMEGSKDCDGSSPAVEAIAVRSSPPSNRAAGPAAVLSAWGHLRS